VQADTGGYNQSHRDHGYEGDPLRPLPGQFYGFLVTAAAN
jgi:hypothetical protein